MQGPARGSLVALLQEPAVVGHGLHLARGQAQGVAQHPCLDAGVQALAGALQEDAAQVLLLFGHEGLDQVEPLPGQGVQGAGVGLVEGQGDAHRGAHGPCGGGPGADVDVGPGGGDLGG